MVKKKFDDNAHASKRSTSNKTRTFWASVCCGIVFAISAVLYSYWFIEEIDGENDHNMDSSAILFKYFDSNNDGVLSFEEFKNLSPQLKAVNGEIEYDSTIDESHQFLTIQTFFQPLLIDTLKSDKDTLGSSSLDNLKTWVQPYKSWQNFDATNFEIFLPKDRSSIQLADAYYIIDPPSGNIFGSVTLPSTRYFPPRLVYDGEIMIHRLLTAFHPRPFVHSRFAPQGSIACLRAYNAKYLDVLFRIHAEFQLNDHPLYPFWFTPAQFTGHLIISRDANEILDFHMFVPSSQRLNVDMEWLNGPDTNDMEVDIGFMPQMELRATQNSVPAFRNDQDQRNKFVEIGRGQSAQVWDEEVTFEEAASAMEVKMYPFKEVQYYNFTSVWQEAERQQKPVHSIVLWGALDDQSC